MLAAAEAFSRDDDEEALRVVFLAARGVCLHDNIEPLRAKQIAVGVEGFDHPEDVALGIGGDERKMRP